MVGEFYRGFCSVDCRCARRVACAAGLDFGGNAVGKIIRKELLYLVAAMLMLVLALPFLPTRVLLQPRSLTVVGDDVLLDRHVTIPISADWLMEYEQISPPPRAALECYQSGLTHFEKRNGAKLVFKHNCDFSGPTVAEWQIRGCWQAIVVFGIKLKSTCITSTFFPNIGAAMMEQKELRENLTILRGELEQLKGSDR